MQGIGVYILSDKFAMLPLCTREPAPWEQRLITSAVSRDGRHLLVTLFSLSSPNMRLTGPRAILVCITGFPEEWGSVQ